MASIIGPSPQIAKLATDDAPRALLVIYRRELSESEFEDCQDFPNPENPESDNCLAKPSGGASGLDSLENLGDVQF